MTADDSLRNELAAALDDTATGLWMFGQHGPGWGYKVADALLPVVERLQRQAAAKALREAVTAVVQAGLASSAVMRLLRDRADGIEAT